MYEYLYRLASCSAFCLFALAESGCTSVPVVSKVESESMASIASTTEEKQQQEALVARANKSLNDYNAVTSCLRKKETLFWGIRWNHVAYISAVVSGISSFGASAAAAGGFGAFTGVSKYFDDDNAYRKARATLETQYPNGMSQFKQELKEKKYDDANLTLYANDFVIRQHRLECNLTAAPVSGTTPAPKS